MSVQNAALLCTEMRSRLIWLMFGKNAVFKHTPIVFTIGVCLKHNIQQCINQKIIAVIVAEQQQNQQKQHGLFRIFTNQLF